MPWEGASPSSHPHMPSPWLCHLRLPPSAARRAPAPAARRWLCGKAGPQLSPWLCHSLNYSTSQAPSLELRALHSSILSIFPFSASRAVYLLSESNSKTYTPYLSYKPKGSENSVPRASNATKKKKTAAI